MPLLDLKLPEGVVKYSTTKEFSEGTFPKALERIIQPNRASGAYFA